MEAAAEGAAPMRGELQAGSPWVPGCRAAGSAWAPATQPAASSRQETHQWDAMAHPAQRQHGSCSMHVPVHASRAAQGGSYGLRQWRQQCSSTVSRPLLPFKHGPKLAMGNLCALLQLHLQFVSSAAVGPACQLASMPMPNWHPSFLCVAGVDVVCLCAAAVIGFLGSVLVVVVAAGSCWMVNQQAVELVLQHTTNTSKESTVRHYIRDHLPGPAKRIATAAERQLLAQQGQCESRARGAGLHLLRVDQLPQLMLRFSGSDPAVCVCSE
jgi:hypothetical protein